VGDEIKFDAIDLHTFHALESRAAAGEVVATMTKLP
jgi:hypothetical protein